MELRDSFEKQGNLLFKYRGYLPLAIIIPGLLIIYFADFSFNESHWYEALCFLVSLTGLVIRILVVGYSARNTSGRNTEQQVADHLNTTGLYATVRHPLYLGNFLMWFGLCMRTNSLPFMVIACMFFWIYYERIMFAEEQFLRKKHGAAFIEWAKYTPAFIPDLRRWIKPDVTFNFKKVMAQERSGILALFLVFFLTEILITKSFDSVLGHEWIWTAGLAVALINLVTLKYFMKM